MVARKKESLVSQLKMSFISSKLPLFVVLSSVILPATTVLIRFQPAILDSYTRQFQRGQDASGWPVRGACDFLL